MKRSGKESSLLTKVLIIAAAAVLWEISARFSGISPIILPSLLDIFREFFSGIYTGELLAGALRSLQMITSGLGIGIVLALLAAALAYNFRIFAHALDLATAVAHPIPGIALLPLVILWFGTGSQAVIWIIVHSVLWPLVINIRTGFTNTPEHLVMVGRNYALSRGQFLVHILLPGALPFVVSGLKIAWSRAWRAVISAEMVFGAMGGRGGLGWYLFSKRVFMDSAGMFSGILMLIIIGLLFERLIFTTIEQRTNMIWGR